MFKKKRVKAQHVGSLDELRAYMREGLPVLVDLWKADCQPCRMMSGIIDELADEYSGRAHVVKVDVTRVPGAVQAFGVRATPTFVVLANAPRPPSKRARRRGQAAPTPAASNPSLNPRWRVSGMVRKDILAGALNSNGARAVGVISQP